MATIKLDDLFKIEGDSYNWSLIYEEKKEVTEKDGNLKMVTSRDEWHYPTIKNCLEKYVNTATKKCKSVLELIELLTSINKTIDSLNINN